MCSSDGLSMPDMNASSYKSDRHSAHNFLDWRKPGKKNQFKIILRQWGKMNSSLKKINKNNNGNNNHLQSVWSLYLWQNLANFYRMNSVLSSCLAEHLHKTRTKTMLLNSLGSLVVVRILWFLAVCPIVLVPNKPWKKPFKMKFIYFKKREIYC